MSSSSRGGLRNEGCSPMIKFFYTLLIHYISPSSFGASLQQDAFSRQRTLGLRKQVRLKVVNLRPILTYMAEIVYHLKDSEAKLIITHPSCSQTAVKAARAAGLSERSVYLFTDPLKPDKSLPGSLTPWSDLWCSPSEVANWSWYKISSVEEAKSTTAILNYSSG